MSQHVRMVTAPIKPGRLDEMVEFWRTQVAPTAQTLKGYVSARMLVDREQNRVRSIGFWECEADYLASVPWTKQQLARAAELFAGPPTIEGFDLAIELVKA